MLIKVNKIERIYNNVKVLDVKNLKFSFNERVGIIGHNGSGKTTFCETLLGVNKSRKDDLILTKVRKNAVFQEIAYDSSLSIYENARYFYKIFKSNQDLDLLFDEFELSDKKKHKFKNLSGGEKQKLKILFSLLNEPQILLLDEVTNNLDYIWKEKIIHVIMKKINNMKELCLFFISHDLEEIAKICTRLLIFEKGKIVRDIKLNKDIEANLIRIKEETQNVNSSF